MESRRYISVPRSIDDTTNQTKKAIQSHFSFSEDVARFHGTLDIKTLGGAGFASQRTKSDDLKLDLSDYVGIQLCIKKGDSMFSIT